MAQIYMKVEGIDGNVTAAGHDKWIELTDISWNLARTISSKLGRLTNREGGTPSFSSISISKLVDETSPKLFLETCIGKAKKVEIHFCKTGEELEKYLEVILTDVLFGGYAISCSGGGGSEAVEGLTLHFAKIEKKYTPYDSNNKPGTPIPAGYDLINGKKI